MIQVRYGADVPPLTITVNVDATPLNLTTIQGYAAWVYNKKTLKVIAKFSKNTITGFASTVAVNEAIGQFAIYVDKSYLEGQEKGVYCVELGIQTTETNYLDDTFNDKSLVQVGTNVLGEFFELVDGVDKNGVDLS